MFLSILSFFFRLLFILFLFQLVRRVWCLLTGSGYPRRQENSRTSRSEQKVGQMFRDPVCGIYVAQDLALSVRSEGQQVYFCSDQCRQQFLKKK